MPVYNPLVLLMRNRDAAFILLGLLSAYSLAGCLMEHFVVFYAWQLTDSPLRFQTLQTATGMRTLYLYVIPKALTTLLTAYLAYMMDEWWLKCCLAFLIVSWVSSFAVQIPLQLRVKQRGDRVALERLVRTDWVRVGAMVGHCALVFYVNLSLFWFDTSQWEM